MPIKLNLDRVMLERKISLTELADRIGITLANLSILKTNKARAIRFSTLEALCRELECQPGDLLERTPEEPDPERPSVAWGTPAPWCRGPCPLALIRRSVSARIGPPPAKRSPVIDQTLARHQMQ